MTVNMFGALSFKHPLMYSVYIAVFVVCTFFAYYFIAKDKWRTFCVLAAIIYTLISLIFINMLWQMSISSIIILVIALLICKDNSYDVFKKYLLWALTFIIFNFILKWFILYFNIKMADAIDSIGTCCFDMLAIGICSEVIYTTLRFPKDKIKEAEVQEVLNILKQYSMFCNLTSFYKLNVLICGSMSRSLSIKEKSVFYNKLINFVVENKEQLANYSKEKLLKCIMSLYSAN